MPVSRTNLLSNVVVQPKVDAAVSGVVARPVDGVTPPEGDRLFLYGYTPMHKLRILRLVLAFLTVV